MERFAPLKLFEEALANSGKLAVRGLRVYYANARHS